MKKINLLLFLLLFSYTFSNEIVSEKGSFNWANAWETSAPKSGDIIVISSESVVNVDEILQFQSSNKTTKLLIYGTLNFTSGKKINLPNNSIVEVYNSGKISPSENGGGNSERIQIGNTTFWKSSDGVYNGKKLTPTSTLKNSFNRNLSTITEEFTISNSKDEKLTSKNGTVIEIPKYSFKKSNGANVEGNVQLKFTEILTKKNMILTNKTTLTKNNRFLISDGEFLLEAYQSNQLLQLEQSLKITKKSQFIDQKMQMFVGESGKNESISWTESKNELKIENLSNITGNYSFNVSDFSWLNIDKFYDDPRPKGSIRVITPEGLNEQNTLVLIAIKNLNGVFPLNRFENNTFSLDEQLIAIGETINVIVLSSYGDNWYYRIIKTSSESNKSLTIDYLIPASIIDLDQLLNEIN